jgi:uncharacterized phage protein gp47/JayE
MLGNPLLDGWATDERSQPYQAIAPAAYEIAEGYVQLQRIVYLRSLVGPEGMVAYGPYLDELGDQEMGISRLDATPARIVLEFQGSAAAIIPQGTRVETTASPPVSFLTVAATQLQPDVSAPGGFSGGGLADCTQLGSVGNVQAYSVTRFPNGAPAGVTSVTNPSSTPLIPGADQEADDAYRTRLLRYRRDPPNGCNAAQFRMWAEEVPGCGRAECIRPLEPIGPQGQIPPTPGTVWVYITGDQLIIPYAGTGLMAAPAIVDAVQQYIAPRMPAVEIEPGQFPAVSLPDDGVGGTLSVLLPTRNMNIAGIWSLRPALALTGTIPAPATVVGTAQVFNVTDNVILDSRPNGQAPQGATHDYQASELAITPPTHPSAIDPIDFFWDGSQVPLQKNIEVRVMRSAAQAAVGNGVLELHGVWILSTFSDPAQEALAPVDDRVEVYASIPRPIEVEANVALKPGWTLAAASAWCEAALSDYLRSIVYGGSAPPVQGLPDRRANDVLYGVVGAVLLGFGGPGGAHDSPIWFYDPTTLRVNGGVEDVRIWTGDIAVLGTCIFTEIITPPVTSLGSGNGTLAVGVIAANTTSAPNWAAAPITSGSVTLLAGEVHGFDITAASSYRLEARLTFGGAIPADAIATIVVETPGGAITRVAQQAVAPTVTVTTDYGVQPGQRVYCQVITLASPADLTSGTFTTYGL